MKSQNILNDTTENNKLLKSHSRSTLSRHKLHAYIQLEMGKPTETRTTQKDLRIKFEMELPNFYLIYYSMTFQGSYFRIVLFC